MNKAYEFIAHPYECEFGSSPNTTINYTINTKDMTKDDLLESFTYFMRACGYSIGTEEVLEFVDYSEPEPAAVAASMYFPDQEFADITRVELIDGEGRRYTNHDVAYLGISLQDDNRTMKVFVQ